MNIRKSLTKMTLTLAAFFWAGCEDDSTSTKGVEPIDIGDCESDNVACGGGMIALYGVGPVYDVSSSSVSSSDSCEQGCNEMISSSSESANEPASSDSEVLESSSSEERPSWVSGYPTDEIDLNSVRARGDSTCAEHGGLETARQYEPAWGSAEMRGDAQAVFETQEKIEEALKSGKLSDAKTSCLEGVKNELMGSMAALYGCPLFENTNDIWEYLCKDGTAVKDEKYTQLYNEDEAAEKAAKEKALAEYQKLLDKCDGI